MKKVPCGTFQDDTAIQATYGIFLGRGDDGTDKHPESPYFMGFWEFVVQIVVQIMRIYDY